MKVVPNVNGMEMVEAALAYAANGIAVFPVVANEKRPLTANGFHNASVDMDVINGWFRKSTDVNIGMATGIVNGILVVDVDIKNGKDGEASLSELETLYGLLPETRKHKTPSGGYHLLFGIGSEAVGSSRDAIGVGLDIRADGGYVVAPPSVVDGGRYEVVNPDVSVADAPEWLIRLAREKKGASPVVKEEQVVVSEGQRNDHIFKFALNCKRQGNELDQAIMKAMTENDKCVPPLPVGEVIKTVSSAYRYESSYLPPEIEELNQKHAFVSVGGKSRILNEVFCPIFDRPDITLSSPTDFMYKYANRKVNDKQLGHTWFHHPNRRAYEGIVFSPGKDTPGYYNLWRGFAVEPKQGDCSLFLKHIEEVICSGNRECYQYVVAWMAHAVQNIDDLIGTSIVLKGKQGAGKGVFIREFGKLFGTHFTHISQSAHLTGKFNAHLKHTILLFADEACWGGDKQAEGPLKALITEPTLIIEGKGQDPFTVKNHVHVLVSSNNDWIVPCGLEERRFLVLDVSEKYYQNEVYFSPLYREMDNGGREALLYYLMNYNLKGLDLRTFPKTEALFEMKMQGATPVQKFWFEKLMAGALDNTLDHWNDGVIVAERLQSDYADFTGKAGVKHRGTDTELGVQLRKLVPVGQDIKGRKTFPGSNTRTQIYKFPDLQTCRDYFVKMLNQPVSWPDEGVALRN